MFNANEEAKIINQKLCLTGILLYPGVEVKWDKICMEERPLGVNRVEMKEWEQNYPSLFKETTQYINNSFLRKLQVCHKEIEWKIQLENIPRTNIGVTYNVSEVGEKEAMEFVRKLEREGIVSQLEVTKKGFYSHVMFLQKASQKGVRKVVDFRLLNAYALTWKTNFLGTLATIRMVPTEWRVYTSIDLSQGYFHIPVCEMLSLLFAFECQEKRFKYRCLPQG